MPVVPSIREAFCAALESPPRKREELLAQLPAAVRAEVASLLEAHDSAGSFLNVSEDGPFPPRTRKVGPSAHW